MKKYWKFTSIIAVIVLSIGTFYVNSAMSATQYPEFVINKKSGNAEEIKSLVLEGGYHEGSSMNYTNNHLEITSDGSEYRNGSSLLDLVIGRPAPMIQELQDEYRNFMRGKENLDSFFENNKLLAYADVKYKIGSSTSRDFKFAISILNKDDGNTTSYDIKVPDSSVVDYIVVNDVQVVEKELKIITHNYTSENEKNFNEKHIYTLDISTGAISNNETILSIPDQQGNTHIYADLIKTNHKQANEDLIFIKTQEKMIQDEESDMNAETSRELISYNLETNDQKTIEFPENLKEHQISFFDGTTIYFSNLSEQNLIITPINIENGQAGKEFTTQLSNETSNTEPPIIVVKDGKLYVTTQLTNLTTKASVAVFDVKTSETLYEGEVERKNSPKNMEEFELYIYEMSVK
ncbi:hypothetical protein [Paenisporosarcina sp.]|uniref:hypothetical protein n=1 Tax=Paenisporosarcina sp. TaxID=1932001 RepID=UPI003C7398E9